MKLLAVVVAFTFFTTVGGTTYQFGKCIRLEVDGTLTVTAKNNSMVKNVTIDLSKPAPANITGNCSDKNVVSMTVPFGNGTSWVLLFSQKNSQVSLQQTVHFNPSVLFDLTSDAVAVTTEKNLQLSSNDTSFMCKAEQQVAFKPVEANYTFSAVQKISNLHVQAFGLVNNSFSPAEDCSADQTTVPTTPQTTEPVPTVGPIKATTFVVKDKTGVPCFRLEAGLQAVVEYNTTDDVMAFSKPIAIDSTNVTGSCAENNSNTATMVITGSDYVLTITETRKNEAASSDISLMVMLDSDNFPKAAKPNASMTFTSVSSSFHQSSVTTYYVCHTEQSVAFTNTRTELFADEVRLQAFGLNNGSFTGNGEQCSLDPTPSPSPSPTPAPGPGRNTYIVNGTNATCIVLVGDITFTNVTYTKKGGSMANVTIYIPPTNSTVGNVHYHGSCDLEGGNAQDLVITFNQNWTLTITFTRVFIKGYSLAVKHAEFSVRDIEFVYYEDPAFFPNTSHPYQEMSASKVNISGEYLKGTAGGSYKCIAKQTTRLSRGVGLETTHLQYMAFNPDFRSEFNADVTECSADEDSNSIVPIAVGAALAGLVVIVLIAYLIGRRRSRRQGYESV